MIIYFIVFPLIFSLIAIKLAKRDFLLSVAFLVALQVFLKLLLWKTIPQIGFASGTFLNICIGLLCLYYVAKHPVILKTKCVRVYFGAIFFTLVYLAILGMFQGYAHLEHVYYVRNYFWNFLLFTVFISLPQRPGIETNSFVKFIIALTIIQTGLCML
ncbi:MAG: hypothetical protein WAW23_01490, partial [Candidatus Methanoperedens sp.]